MAARETEENPMTARWQQAVPKDVGFLSPRFRSAAAMAGWDEEALLLATLVVDDTPVRESRHKKRPSSGGTGSNTRKRRSRRRSPEEIPHVVLSLDDDEKDAKKAVTDDEEKVVNVEKEKENNVSNSADAAAGSGLLRMDRLREELSCAICLEICFEPSTTPCGHSFCMKCLKHAATKCGKRCPKCRQLISNARSCTVNTVLWNTIQLLFPNEVETRRTSASSSSSNKDVNHSPPRSNSFIQGSRSLNISRGFITQGITRSTNTSRSYITQGNTRSNNSSRSYITQGSTRRSNTTSGFVRASELVTTRSSVRSDHSDDSALAYRLQQEEFLMAFDNDDERLSPRSTTVSTARANLRAMASRAIRLRARGWPV